MALVSIGHYLCTQRPHTMFHLRGTICDMSQIILTDIQLVNISILMHPIQKVKIGKLLRPLTFEVTPRLQCVPCLAAFNVGLLARF